MSTTYTFWRGARRNEDEPCVLGPKKGQANYGPGIACTTWFESAEEFARGGGSVRKIVITPRLVLENAALSLNDALDFVTTVVTKAKQEAIIDRLLLRANKGDFTDRVLLGNDSYHIPAETLMVMCINQDMIVGTKGIALAEFYSHHGIDCSFQRAKGRDEYWGFIYTPSIIQSYERVKSSDIPLNQRELPSPAEQLASALEQLKSPERRKVWVPDDLSR